MSLLRERDPRFVNLEKTVGIFVFLALAAISLGVVFVGFQQGLFTPKTTIYFIDDSGKDLVEGLAVEIRGFTVGKVSGITLNDAGKVEVEMSINRNYMKWIRTDSVAMLVKEMFIGDSKIEISPGSSSQQQIEKKGMIIFERELELGELAKGVMDEVRPVLIDIKKFIHYIDDPEGDFKSTMANFSQLTGDLIDTRARIDELAAKVGKDLTSIVTGIDSLVASLHGEVLPQVRSFIGESEKTVGQAGDTLREIEAFVDEDLQAIATMLSGEILPRLDMMLEKTDKTLEGTDGAVSTVRSELPDLIEKVKSSLENIEIITSDLKRATIDAPELAREGGDLLEESRALIKRTREIWPLRSRIAPAGEESIDVDSYQRIE